MTIFFYFNAFSRYTSTLHRYLKFVVFIFITQNVFRVCLYGCGSSGVDDDVVVDKLDVFGYYFVIRI